MARNTFSFEDTTKIVTRKVSGLSRNGSQLRVSFWPFSFNCLSSIHNCGNHMHSKYQDQHERNVKADVILWTWVDSLTNNIFWRYGLFFCRCVNKATKPRKHVLQYIEMNPCFKIQLGRSNFYNGKILKDGPTIGYVLFTHFVLTIFKLRYCVCTCFMIGPLRVFLSLYL